MRTRPASTALVGVLALTAVACSSSQAGSGRFDETEDVQLTTSAVVPDPVTTNASGRAVFEWDEHGGISYAVNVQNLSSRPTEIHIHGPAGPNATAPVLASIDLRDTTVTGEIARGMIATSLLAHFQRDLIKDLIEDGRAYVDVHTVTHPKGEVRGQFKE